MLKRIFGQLSECFKKICGLSGMTPQILTGRSYERWTTNQFPTHRMISFMSSLGDTTAHFPALYSRCVSRTSLCNTLRRCSTKRLGQVGDRERECVGVGVCGERERSRWGQGKRVCGCGGVWGGREKAEMLKGFRFSQVRKIVHRAVRCGRGL